MNDTLFCYSCNIDAPLLPCSSYHGPELARDRDITLHNISVAICSCGITPEIPALGPLMDLVRTVPHQQHFSWLAPTARWAIGKHLQPGHPLFHLRRR